MMGTAEAGGKAAECAPFTATHYGFSLLCMRRTLFAITSVKAL
jgi:hypothetical protein